MTDHASPSTPNEASEVPKTLWFEVWWEAGLEGQFFLVLHACSDQSFKILNPQSANHVEGVFTRYEDAYEWLREDEYELVGGRVEIS
ncbi:MAG: hypothetical protein IT370_36735 [Deltaproteobacteria bacterium]|nr:hypothetical protein [Deltaproteobacteria bacterium]